MLFFFKFVSWFWFIIGFWFRSSSYFFALEFCNIHFVSWKSNFSHKIRYCCHKINTAVINWFLQHFIDNLRGLITVIRRRSPIDCLIVLKLTINSSLSIDGTHEKSLLGDLSYSIAVIWFEITLKFSPLRVSVRILTALNICFCKTLLSSYFCTQWCMQNSVWHLRWRVLQKYLTTKRCWLCLSDTFLSWMFGGVLNTPLLQF